MTRRKLLRADLTIGAVTCDVPIHVKGKGWQVKPTKVGIYAGETAADAQAFAAAIRTSWEGYKARHAARPAPLVASAPVATIATADPLACPRCSRHDFRTPNGHAWHVTNALDCAGRIAA